MANEGVFFSHPYKTFLREYLRFLKFVSEKIAFNLIWSNVLESTHFPGTFWYILEVFLQNSSKKLKDSPVFVSAFANNSFEKPKRK